MSKQEIYDKIIKAPYLTQRDKKYGSIIDDNKSFITDPLRDYLFLIKFDDYAKDLMGINDEEFKSVMFRINNFTTPTKTLKFHEPQFYGQTQNIPYDIEYEKSFTLNMDESENQVILYGLNNWINKVHRSQFTNGNLPANPKQRMKTNMTLYVFNFGEYSKMLDYYKQNMGISILNIPCKYKIKYYDIIPESFGGRNYDYSSSGNIIDSIPFKCEWFDVQKNEFWEYYSTILPSLNVVEGTDGINNLKDYLKQIKNKKVKGIVENVIMSANHAIRVGLDWGPKVIKSKIWNKLLDIIMDNEDTIFTYNDIQRYLKTEEVDFLNKTIFSSNEISRYTDNGDVS